MDVLCIFLHFFEKCTALFLHFLEMCTALFAKVQCTCCRLCGPNTFHAVHFLGLCPRRGPRLKGNIRHRGALGRLQRVRGGERWGGIRWVGTRQNTKQHPNTLNKNNIIFKHTQLKRNKQSPKDYTKNPKTTRNLQRLSKASNNKKHT